MKKLTILISFIIFISTFSVHAQNCLPDGITFSTQAQVDTFQDKYPGCSRILGPLTINSDFIKNLNGLQVITFIGGDLVSDVNDSLVDFTGLNALKEVGGSLHIWGNYSLKSLEGLNSLEIIGDHLVVAYHPQINDITALGELSELGGNLTIVYNDSLTSLDGLKRIIPSTIDQLNINNNPLLTKCAINSICEYLTLPVADTHIYMNGEGCSSEAEVKYACDHLSVNDLYLEPKCTLYPNPAHHVINIDLDKRFDIQKITLTDLTGKVLKTINLNTRIIQLEDMKEGIYFMEILIDNKIIRRKFMVN